MRSGWEELLATRHRLAAQIRALHQETRDLLSDAARLREQARRTRSEAARARVEANHRRLSFGRRLDMRPTGPRTGAAAPSADILRQARPSEHPASAEIIALHELHAEHERSAGRDASADAAQRRANRIRRLSVRSRATEEEPVEQTESGAES